MKKKKKTKKKKQHIGIKRKYQAIKEHKSDFEIIMEKQKSNYKNI